MTQGMLENMNRENISVFIGVHPWFSLDMNWGERDE